MLQHIVQLIPIDLSRFWGCCRSVVAVVDGSQNARRRLPPPPAWAIPPGSPTGPTNFHLFFLQLRILVSRVQSELSHTSDSQP
jgi:hypothetical protein